MPTFPNSCGRREFQLHKRCINGCKCTFRHLGMFVIIFIVSFLLLLSTEETILSLNIALSPCLFVFCMLLLFIYGLTIPEPQTASCLYCYPASFAKHHGRLLEACVRLQLFLHCHAKWDGRSAGKRNYSWNYCYKWECLSTVLWIILGKLK